MKIREALLSLNILAFFLMSIACDQSAHKEKSEIKETDTEQLRAPAYPLITHNPYFSIWSMGDELNGMPTQHWTGANHSLLGVVKMDGRYFRFLGAEIKSYKTVVPTSEEASYAAAYTESKPDDDWNTAGFDDSKWKNGAAPFSDDRALAKTRWTSEDLWFRRSFDMEDSDIESLYLKLRHDDNVTAYINGDEVYQTEGWQHGFKFLPVDQNIISSLKEKDNVLAIHIKNTAGGQYLDAGLVTDAPSMNNIEIEKAKQTGVTLNATQTIYTFDCGPAQLTATFTSPLLLDDLDLLSRPISYLSVDVKFADEKEHKTQLYLGASTGIAVNTAQQEVAAEAMTANGLNILRAGTTGQPVLEKKGDILCIDWGYMYLATASENNTSSITSASEALNVLNNHSNKNNTEKGRNLMLNTVTDFGEAKDSINQVYMLGYDELYSINYFGDQLKPWWKKDGGDMTQLLTKAKDEYSSIMERATSFDKQLVADAIQAGSKKYADLCVLAYRQSIAAHTLVEARNGDLLWLSKENNSNGSINTVDLTYPSAPLFLVYNPELQKGQMNGIFDYSESGKWKKTFAAHDLGTYPIATGQTYGEDMPVEEAGNMVILALAIAQQEGNAAYAKKHWKTLTTWSEYLMKSGFDPENQLSTDDFAGHLARNANLSVKAILALASYGKMAGMLGEKDTEKKYTDAAQDFAEKWMELAGDGDHYDLAFGQKDTWSQKYNLVWDSILDLNIFPQEVADKEIAYYLGKQNKYGLPLDSRETYTKSDWVMWTATLTDNKEDFNAIVDPIWGYANDTPDRVPLSDWHWTLDAEQRGFKARSVVGGYYLKMLKEQAQ